MLVLTSDVKLIVWDLDDTLWQGTLMNHDALLLREEFVDYIKETAKRGVVHSLCSKNDFEPTKAYICSLGLWDLFVFPSINWEEKGARVQKIMEQLQVDPTETIFIDDNASNLEDALRCCDGLRTFFPEEFLEWIHKENSDVNQAAQ